MSILANQAWLSFKMEVLLQELKKQIRIDFHFECDICFNRVTKIRLDCGHMMCKECLSTISYVMTTKLTRVDIKCPYCPKKMARELSWKPPVLADYNNLLESIEVFFRKVEEIGAEKKTSSTNDQPLVPSSSSSFLSSAINQDISRSGDDNRDGTAEEVWMEEYSRLKAHLERGESALNEESVCLDEQCERCREGDLSQRQQDFIKGLLLNPVREIALHKPQTIAQRNTTLPCLEPSMPSSSSSSTSSSSISSSSFPFKPKSVATDTSARPKVYHIPPKKPSEPCATDLPSPLPRIVLPPATSSVIPIASLVRFCSFLCTHPAQERHRPNAVLFFFSNDASCSCSPAGHSLPELCFADK